MSFEKAYGNTTGNPRTQLSTQQLKTPNRSNGKFRLRPSGVTSLISD